MKRIEWLDSLRGFAMFLVIVGHVSSVPASLGKWIYAFHMPLFFVIAGIVFRYEKYANLKECAIDKSKKLLIPYALLFIVNIPFWYINRKILDDSTATPADMLLGFVTANQKIGAMTSGALWFLPCLFLASVLFWILIRLDSKGKLNLEASIIACFVLAWFLSTFYSVSTIWCWATVPMATVFLWIGWTFGQNLQRFEQIFSNSPKSIQSSKSIIPAIPSNPANQSNSSFLKGKFIAIAIVVLAIGTWIAAENGRISMFANSYKTIAFALIAALGLSLGFAMLFMKLPKIWLFDYACRNSLTFFGFHIAVLRFLENWEHTERFTDNNSLWTGIIVFLLLIPISMFVNKFCPFIVAKKYPKKIRRQQQPITGESSQ